MDKLLAWSVAQQTGDEEAIQKIGKPDEKILSQLFGGPDEPTLMKQSMAIVQDPSVSNDDKIIALENFEMLIENLDNANNIENMKLWDVIIQLLNPEFPVDFRVLASSIIAIAVQNNENAQTHFLKYPHGLESLIKYAKEESTPLSLQLKLLFAISSVVRNNSDSLKMFNKFNGWESFSVGDAAKDKLNLRKMSLISSILSNTKDFKFEIEPKFRQLNLASFLIENLECTVCQEKALQNLYHLIELNYKFEEGELGSLREKMAVVGGLKEHYTVEFKAVEGIL